VAEVFGKSSYLQLGLVPVALEVQAEVVEESDFLHLAELEHLVGFIDESDQVFVTKLFYRQMALQQHCLQNNGFKSTCNNQPILFTSTELLGFGNSAYI
jgi:hypothetical protein